MPPSTATKVRPPGWHLTAITRYRVTPARAAIARPGSITICGRGYLYSAQADRSAASMTAASARRLSSGSPERHGTAFAAEVELGEHDLMAVAYLGHHGDHLRDRLTVSPGVGELRPELAVQSDQVQARLIQDALDRTGRLAAGRRQSRIFVGVGNRESPGHHTR